MTEHQEKELFRTLGNLVGGVKQIQQTLDGHTKTLDDHTKTLDGHTKTLDDHTKTLDGHTKTLDGHTGMLKFLVSKTDSIAEQVMKNDERLTARITSVESSIENLGGQIH